MNRIQVHAMRFEDLVARILASAGYAVEREVKTQVGGPMFAFDLVFQSPDGSRSIAEIKWTRRSPVPVGMLRDWAARLASYLRATPGSQAVLIVSGVTEAAHREWIEEQFEVDVWDSERLRFLVRGNAALTMELLAFEEQSRGLEAERGGDRTSAAGGGPPRPPEPPQSPQPLDADETPPQRRTVDGDGG